MVASSYLSYLKIQRKIKRLLFIKILRPNTTQKRVFLFGKHVNAGREDRSKLDFT